MVLLSTTTLSQKLHCIRRRMRYCVERRCGGDVGAIQDEKREVESLLAHNTEGSLIKSNKEKRLVSVRYVEVGRTVFTTRRMQLPEIGTCSFCGKLRLCIMQATARQSRWKCDSAKFAQSKMRLVAGWFGVHQVWLVPVDIRPHLSRRHAHVFHCGFLFSKKAFMPSCASSPFACNAITLPAHAAASS